MVKINNETESRMERIDVFFPRYEEKEQLKTVVFKTNNPVLNEDLTKHADAMFPINPMTGNIDSDVTKLLDASINPMEKERIMANLIKMPASKRKNLSDDELIQMLPSRRNSTLTDIDAVRDYFESEFLSKIEDGSEGETEIENTGQNE